MSFPRAASIALRDSQLRRNLAKATGTIRKKRAAVVGEVPDWTELRQAGSAHILVPAIQKNRSEIREIFARELNLPA